MEAYVFVVIHINNQLFHDCCTKLDPLSHFGALVWQNVCGESQESDDWSRIYVWRVQWTPQSLPFLEIWIRGLFRGAGGCLLQLFGASHIWSKQHVLLFQRREKSFTLEASWIPSASNRTRFINAITPTRVKMSSLMSGVWSLLKKNIKKNILKLSLNTFTLQCRLFVIHASTGSV